MTKQRILVAEDNPGLARVLEFKLRKEGFEVVVCRDGQSAWERAQCEDFDAVVTDYEMPGLNGGQLCGNIRQLERLAKLPLLLVTAREPELDIEALTESGITRIYPKPYSPRQLIDAIHSLIADAARCV